MSARRLFSTRYFTWLHTPKTGGTWLHGVLTRHAPPSWEVSAGDPAHVRLSEVPTALTYWHGHPERVGLPIVATVRNPWDWYVSLYFFLEQHRVNGTGGFALPPNQREQGLIDWVSIYSRGNTIRDFRRALPRILEDMHSRACFRAAVPQYRFLRAHDGSLGVTAVRFESLRQGMVEALSALGAGHPVVTSALMQSPKVNTSGHASFIDCYDEETRDLVAEYEAWTIETFGYTFGHS